MHRMVPGAALLAAGLAAATAWAGNTSQPTQRGARPAQPSVYCQDVGGVPTGPDYGGTRRQIPFPCRSAQPAQGAVCAAASPDLRARLMQWAAEMDRIATANQDHALAASDKFFRAMARAISANLQFLAQKPGVPAQQMGRAIWTYLNNDYNENDRRLHQAAIQAAKRFEADPADFLGEQSGNLMFGAAMERLPGVMRLPTCRLSAGGAGALESEAVQLEKAAQRLQQTEQAAQTFGAGQQNASCRVQPPSFGSNGRPARPGPLHGGPNNSVNPFGQNKNCVPVAIAAEKRRLTGRPWTDSDVRLGAAEDATGIGETIGLLRKHFGNLPIPDLRGYRLVLQHEGVPVFTSRAALEAELTAAGQASGHASGIVFVDYPPKRVFVAGPNGTMETFVQEGHAFNARYENGAIRYVDDQSGFQDAAFWFDNAEAVYIYRTQ